MAMHDLILAVGLVVLAFVESIVMFAEGPPPPLPPLSPDVDSEIMRKRLDARRRSVRAPATRSAHSGGKW